MQHKKTPWDNADGWRLNLPPAPRLELQGNREGGKGAGHGDAHNGDITSPMHGQILQISVKPGDQVKRGHPLAIVEAMKMEHTILAPFDGVVDSVNFPAGERVEEGALLLRLKRSIP